LASLLPGARGGTLVFYEESLGGTVAVVEQQAGQTRFRRLYIQGVSNSGDAMPSLRYMRLQALLPLIIHGGEPRSALVIGLGTGITAGALLRFPGLEQRVCAELLPAVVCAAPLFQGNCGAASDPRIETHARDGRRELLQNPERYDLITLEPPPPSAAGVVNLYSSDFYVLAGARLQQGAF
jgi:spermidine synthase